MQTRMASMQRAGGARACCSSQSRRHSVRVCAVSAAPPATAIPRWDAQHAVLKSKGLKTVSPEEAQGFLATGKWVLVDVRPASAHEDAHPEGAINVPLYQPIKFDNGFDFKKMMRQIAYASNGVSPVEVNPNFIEELKTKAAGKGVIAMCEAGGTLRPSVNFPEGKPSRSLQACYRALAAETHTVDNIYHLERGVFGWYQADLPMNGDYSPDVGRTPMAAAEPTLQLLNQARGYELNENDTKVSEQKKNPLWPW